jgi:hypothetical protein
VTALSTAAFADAPNDTVYFANGTIVEAVRGDARPVSVLHATGQVLALAATNNDLYVEVGAKITDYARPSMAKRASWSLPSAARTPTTAELDTSPGVLWSDSSWATDASGFEYATVVAISTTTSSEKIVDRDAFPTMVANTTGVYYETLVGTKDHFAHVMANGTRSLSPPTKDFYVPVTLSHGYLAVFPMRGAGLPYVDEYSTSTLAELHSSRLSVATTSVIGTTQGVLAIESPCSGYTCPTAQVVWVNVTNGAETGALALPNAQRLLYGSHPVAINEVHGSAYLVRLS